VTLAGQGGRILILFGSQVVLAHLISPADFGLIAMSAPIVGFVQLFNELGLLEATIQRPHLTQRELSALFWISVFVSTVLAVLVAAAGPLIARLYAEPRAAPVTACLACTIIMSGLASQPMALLNRRMEFIRLAVIDLASTAAMACLGIAAAAMGFGYWSLVLMQATNSATLLALAWSLTRWRPSHPRLEKGMATLIGFGGNVTGTNVLSYLSHNADNVLIGATSNSAALGLYDRAYKLMLLPIIQVTMPFTRVAIPLLSRLSGSSDLYCRAHLQMIQAMLFVTTPCLVFAIVMADRLVPMALGDAWGEAAPIFSSLGFGTLVWPLVMSTTWLFISQGRARQQFMWNCIGSGLIICSFFAGLPWGPLGVARSSAAFIVLFQAPLLCWAATREGPLRLGMLLRACVPFTVSALGVAPVVCLVRAWLDAVEVSGIGSIVILASVMAVTHLAVMAGLASGRQVLRGVWSLRHLFRPQTV